MIWVKDIGLKHVLVLLILALVMSLIFEITGVTKIGILHNFGFI